MQKYFVIYNHAHSDIYLKKKKTEDLQNNYKNFQHCDTPAKIPTPKLLVFRFWIIQLVHCITCIYFLKVYDVFFFSNAFLQKMFFLIFLALIPNSTCRLSRFPGKGLQNHACLFRHHDEALVTCCDLAMLSAKDLVFVWVKFSETHDNEM